MSRSAVLARQPRLIWPALMPQIGLGLLAAVHGLLYLLVIPPWQAPDETSHVEHTLLWLKLGRTATPADAAAAPEIGQAIADSLYTFRAYEYLGYSAPDPRVGLLRAMPFFGSSTTLGRFSLAYPVYALAVAPFAGADILTQLYVLRLVSVALGVATVLVAYVTARRVASETPELAAGLALLMIFIPQRAFINASVNDGNLAEFLAAVTFYWLVDLLQGGLTGRRLAACAAATLAAVLTKSTALFLVPLLAFCGGGAWLSHLRRAQRWPWLMTAAALMGLVGLSVVIIAWSPASGPALAVLSRGGVGLQQAIAQRLAEEAFGALQWQMFQTFWASFGWLRVNLPEPLYVFWAAIALIGVVGLPLGGWTLIARRQTSVGVTLLLGAAFCWLVPVAVYFVVPASAPLHQGRYLFPGLVPLGLLVVAGWLGLVRRPRASLALLGLCLITLDALVLWGTALPYFYR